MGTCDVDISNYVRERRLKDHLLGQSDPNVLSWSNGYYLTNCGMVLGHGVLVYGANGPLARSAFSCQNLKTTSPWLLPLYFVV